MTKDLNCTCGDNKTTKSNCAESKTECASCDCKCANSCDTCANCNCTCQKSCQA
ncbi:hypothetical protein [Mesoplasma seiffertii]|uniref:hypothetical protein n=1 Tax=Mesoplasma seiffertii TaxID=28224 RepID=UPI0012EB345B|nr:hypothetical protein [Mesoplasma seiffertii]